MKTVPSIIKKNYSILGFGGLLVFLLICSEVIKPLQTTLPAFGQFKGFGGILPTPALYPANKSSYPLPELSAKSVIAVDVASTVVLYEENADLRLLPASITKIMTALIVLENYRLDEVLSVGNIKISGNTVKLTPGEKITVENLLYGLLVGSGNDAAEMLAENFPEGRTGFVWAMNQKAQELGLKNTNFTNPAGLDGDGHYSTARDLAKLTIVAIKNPVILQIVSTPELLITDVSGTITHHLKNTNELVGKLAEIKGVKTGWTENAGECLVALAKNDGKEIVTVILGSTNRFGETQKLTDWIFKNFSWEVIAPTNYR